MVHRQSRARRPATSRAWAALALLTLLAALLVTAPAASAVPAKFWGVDAVSPPSAEQFERLKRGGVDTVRVLIEWGTVEPQRGQLDWSSVDPIMTRAGHAGMEVLPFITGAPSWAVKNVSVNRASHSFAPAHLPVRTAAERSAWQGMLRSAVARYGPGGTFWAENPEVPDVPIRTWQIWNEENFKYFVARPDPAEYAKLVQLSYSTLKSVDPGAGIVLGGMFVHPKEGEDRYKKRHPRTAYFATEFLEKMYKAMPSIRKKFGGIALHPYSRDYHLLKPDIEEVRAVMRAAKDAGKGIWITELGWSSDRPNEDNGGNSFEKGRNGQAKQLKGAFKLLASNQARWNIRRVFWFSVEDAPGACNFCDGSGLFGPGFTPKPAWREYARLAGGSPE